MAAYELVLLGDCRVEKSRFIELLMGSDFAETQNTHKKEAMIDCKLCTIHMHERAGLEEETDGLIRGVEGIVYFYSVTLESSFKWIQAIRDEIEKIQAASTSSASDAATPSGTSPPPAHIVLVGIKCEEEKREVSRKEGNDLAGNWGCEFFEVSVGSEANVDEVLHHMIRLCRQARRVQDGDVGTSMWNWISCLGRGKS